MSNQYHDQLPQLLQRNLYGIWGDAANTWLTNLPGLVAELAKQWHLQDIKPYPNLSYHFVAYAIQHDKPVVIKVGMDLPLLESEYQTLQAFAGCGAIEVLDCSEQHKAILLRQAVPGISLKASALSFTDKAQAYAAVFNSLRQVAKPDYAFAEMSDWLKALERLDNNYFEAGLITKTHVVLNELASLGLEIRLCHGDLHLDNIISDAESYVMIDPKGLMANDCFEAAAFDLLSAAELENNRLDDLQVLAAERNLALAGMLQLDADILIKYFYLRCMLAAQWFIDDAGEPDSMILRAKVFSKLL